MLQLGRSDGPTPLRAGQGIHKAALSQPESRDRKAERVMLSQHARLTAQAFDPTPRIVVRTLRTIPLVEFLSMVAACHKRSEGRL